MPNQTMHARLLPLAALALAAFGSPGSSAVAGESEPGPLVTVAERELPQPLRFIAYGDMRFTPASETKASWPAVRQALVARIAAEHPAAVLLSGDIPYHGGTPGDYAVFAQETRAWREQGLRVFPALGNHEFAGCEETRCLENWWAAFPQLRGHRWYSVALGSQLRAIALDSDTSLLPGSPQRAWLEAELAALPATVRFVVVSLHHPPVADLATDKHADHNPRPNEVSLANYLAGVARRSRTRFVVVAGHTHNYERLEREGIVYLVSGGGGASPYAVERGPDDLYAGPGRDGLNFHYLRFTLSGDRLAAEMVRVEDPESAAPSRFEVRDRFELQAR